MRRWEAEHKGPWDAAVRGSSALRAAILTTFGDEVAQYSGQEVAKILWDYEKFYDTLNIAKLIEKCRAVQYPVKLAALGVLMHSAPRIIRAYDHHINVGIPHNGIIAGCTQSNHFARIFLHGIVRAVLEGSPYNYLTGEPWNSIRTFVDDVSHTVRAKQPILKIMLAAGIILRESRKAGLIVSTKTVVLATNSLSLIHI